MELDPADVISRLPDDILLRIISTLPIRSLVATSALSHRWAHLWALSPSLDFRCLHEYYSPETATESSQSHSVAAISAVLRLHSAPCLFSCHVSIHPTTDNNSTINLLLDHLAIKSIQTLTLNSCGGCRSKSIVPLAVFSLPSLRELDIANLSLEDEWANYAPPALLALRSLFLTDVWDCGSVLDKLLERLCGRLETLRLCGILYEGKIKIRASESLKELEIRNIMQLNSLAVYAPGLRSLKVDLDEWCEVRVEAPWLRALNAETARCLCCVELLEKSLGTYEANIPPRSKLKASSFLGLKKLSIPINLKDIRQVVVLSLVLNECTLLQELELTVRKEVISKSNQACLPCEKHTYWRKKELSSLSCIYHNLHVVKIRDFRGKTLEIEFVWFLISKARVLKSLAIWRHVNCVKEKLEGLLSLSMASPDLVVELHPSLLYMKSQIFAKLHEKFLAKVGKS